MQCSVAPRAGAPLQLQAAQFEGMEGLEGDSELLVKPAVVYRKSEQFHRSPRPPTRAERERRHEQVRQLRRLDAEHTSAIAAARRRQQQLEKEAAQGAAGCRLANQQKTRADTKARTARAMERSAEQEEQFIAETRARARLAAANIAEWKALQTADIQAQRAKQIREVRSQKIAAAVARQAPKPASAVSVTSLSTRAEIVRRETELAKERLAAQRLAYKQLCQERAANQMSRQQFHAAKAAAWHTKMKAQQAKQKKAVEEAVTMRDQRLLEEKRQTEFLLCRSELDQSDRRDTIRSRKRVRQASDPEHAPAAGALEQPQPQPQPEPEPEPEHAPSAKLDFVPAAPRIGRFNPNSTGWRGRNRAQQPQLTTATEITSGNGDEYGRGDGEISPLATETMKGIERVAMPRAAAVAVRDVLKGQPNDPPVEMERGAWSDTEEGTTMRASARTQNRVLVSALTLPTVNIDEAAAVVATPRQPLLALPAPMRARASLLADGPLLDRTRLVTQETLMRRSDTGRAALCLSQQQQQHWHGQRCRSARGAERASINSRSSPGPMRPWTARDAQSRSVSYGGAAGRDTELSSVFLEGELHLPLQCRAAAFEVVSRASPKASTPGVV